MLPNEGWCVNVSCVSIKLYLVYVYELLQLELRKPELNRNGSQKKKPELTTIFQNLVSENWAKIGAVTSTR